jgi:ABC-type phosphate/phosphonate transport system permease subunit
MKIIEDRFTLGFVVGVITLIPPFIWNHLSKFNFGFSNLTFADYASVLIYGNLPNNLSEYIFAVLAVTFWNGLLGVIFVFLLIFIKSKNLIFKGWCYGVPVWFFHTLLLSIPSSRTYKYIT